MNRKNETLNETNAQLKEAKEVAERANKAKSEFLASVSHEIRTPMLDEVRLRQILFNLVGNAVKFTHAGHVELSVREQSRHETRQAVDLEFRIKDTGIGIAPDQKQLIFEAFKQQQGQNTARYRGTA